MSAARHSLCMAKKMCFLCWKHIWNVPATVPEFECHKITKSQLFYMRKFLPQLEVPFFYSSRSHSQDTVERFWFNPTAWHCDVMTSQHDAPTFISLSQLVDVLERWFFSCFYKTSGCWVRKCCQFVFAWWRHVMTSCHDVKNKRCSISACRSAREMTLFLFL